MRGYPYLRNRNGHFYFRIAVPRALRNDLNKSELLYSLKTQDFSTARIRGGELYTICQEVFQIAYANKPDTAKLYLKQSLKQLSYKRSTGTLSPALLSKINNPELITEVNPPNQKEVISAVFMDYIHECKGDRSKTIQKKKATLNLWLDGIGDMPIQAIGKQQAREFKHLVMMLPKNFTKLYKGKSVKEIDFEYIPQNQRLSIKSINHQLGYMRAFINWCTRNGFYEAPNPFTGLALKDEERLEEKRLAFNPEQLNAIFSSPIYQGCLSHKPHDRYKEGNTIIKDSLYWIPLIALYSGARMQEICQLYVSDIKEIDGVWVFDFNADGEDKLLKSSSSKRKTPVHPKLLEMGLLDKLKQNEKRLFPDLTRASDGTYSNYFSKRFNGYLVRIGVKTDKTSFHSFRHTFIDSLRNSEVSREVREALVGHLNKQTAHDTYGSPIGIKRLYKGICLLEIRCPVFNK